MEQKVGNMKAFILKSEERDQQANAKMCATAKKTEDLCLEILASTTKSKPDQDKSTQTVTAKCEEKFTQSDMIQAKYLHAQTNDIICSKQSEGRSSDRRLDYKSKPALSKLS